MQTHIVNARIIDGTGRAPGEPASILITDGRITRIGDAGGHVGDDFDEVLDVAGQTVLPGLIDCHVHLGHPLGDSARWGGSMGRTMNQLERTLNALLQAESALRAGLTTVRDLGCTDEIFPVRQLTETEKWRGPRVLAAGNCLCITGGHSHHKYSLECDGPEGFRRGVRLQVKKGVDVIKICSTGGASTPNESSTAVQMDEDEVIAAVREATKVGLRVASHAHAAEGIKTAVRAGVSTIEHGIRIDQEAADLIVEHDAVLVPTLSIYRTLWERGPAKGLASHVVDKAREINGVHMENVARAVSTGVRLAFGTDSGGPYQPVGGPGIIETELRALCEVGLSPLQAIGVATLGSARACGLEHEIGTLEVGKIADLVLVDGDPLSDLGAMSRVARVMRSGQSVWQPPARLR